MGYWVHALCTAAVSDSLAEIGTFFESLDLAELEIEVGGVSGFDPQRIRDALAVETGPPLPRTVVTAKGSGQRLDQRRKP